MSVIIKFDCCVPLERTIAFESVYPEALQLDVSEKKDLWDATGSIFVWLFLNGELAGESYGVPLSSCGEPIEGLRTVSDSERRSGIYCYSNTILPQFQKQGLGATLKAYWLGLAAGNGFEVVYGHARPGASQAVNAKFGAIFVGDFPDWYGTGETYKMYRLVLNPANVRCQF